MNQLKLKNAAQNIQLEYSPDIFRVTSGLYMEFYDNLYIRLFYQYYYRKYPVCWPGLKNSPTVAHATVVSTTQAQGL